jgi:hypothetical protein
MPKTTSVTEEVLEPGWLTVVMRQVRLENRVHTWSRSASHVDLEAVIKVIEKLEKKTNAKVRAVTRNRSRSR